MGCKGREGENETTGKRGNEGVTGRDRVKQSGKGRRRKSERGSGRGEVERSEKETTGEKSAGVREGKAKP